MVIFHSRVNTLKSSSPALSPLDWKSQFTERDITELFPWLLDGVRSLTKRNIIRVMEMHWKRTGDLTEKQWALLQRWAEEKD